VGLALGIAVWGAVLMGRGTERAAELLGVAGAPSDDTPRRIVEAASTGNLDPGPGLNAAALGNEAFVAGLDRALTLAGGVALVGAVVVFWLLRPSAAGSHAVRPVAAGYGPGGSNG